MREEPRQKSAPGALIGIKLSREIPDDVIPFGDGVRFYSPSEKCLYNAEACVEVDLVATEDD